MTAEIVGLDGAAAAWRTAEPGVRVLVAELGYGGEVADWVMQDLKSRSFKVQYQGPAIAWDEFPVEMRARIAATSQEMKAAYEGLIGAWLIEIVKLECELWAAKFTVA